MQLPFNLAVVCLGMYSTKMKTCSHKNLYVNIRSSFLLIAKPQKQPKCPLKGERLNKLRYTHLYCVYQSAMKWNKVYIHGDLHESPKNSAEWKDPILRGSILYDSISVTFLKFQCYRSGEQIQWFHGCWTCWGRGGACGYEKAA